MISELIDVKELLMTASGDVKDEGGNIREISQQDFERTFCDFRPGLL